MAREKKSKKRLPEVQTEPEFDQRMVDIARVTRVKAGGKRLRFRACVVIGNRQGQVGVGVAKGADVSIAVEKAARKARKNIIDVPIVNETIPHWIKVKYCAAKVLLRPAIKGRGIVAGGAVRTVLDLAGIKNVTAKMLGSNNKIANARATIEALQQLKTDIVKRE